MAKLKVTTLFPYHVEYPKLGGSAGPLIILYCQSAEEAKRRGEEYAYLFLDEPRLPGEEIEVAVSPAIITEDI